MVTNDVFDAFYKIKQHKINALKSIKRISFWICFRISPICFRKPVFLGTRVKGEYNMSKTKLVYKLLVFAWM